MRSRHGQVRQPSWPMVASIVAPRRCLFAGPAAAAGPARDGRAERPPARAGATTLTVIGDAASIRGNNGNGIYVVFGPITPAPTYYMDPSIYWRRSSGSIPGARDSPRGGAHGRRWYLHDDPRHRVQLHSGRPGRLRRVACARSSRSAPTAPRTGARTRAPRCRSWRVTPARPVEPWPSRRWRPSSRRHRWPRPWGPGCRPPRQVPLPIACAAIWVPPLPDRLPTTGNEKTPPKRGLLHCPG